MENERNHSGLSEAIRDAAAQFAVKSRRVNRMFRAMRREKQQLSNQEAVRILEQGKTGVLAVI